MQIQYYTAYRKSPFESNSIHNLTMTLRLIKQQVVLNQHAKYKVLSVRVTERGTAQPVAAQMLHESGERERCRMDSRRGRVLQAATAESRARRAFCNSRDTRDTRHLRHRRSPCFRPRTRPCARGVRAPGHCRPHCTLLTHLYTAHLHIAHLYIIHLHVIHVYTTCSHVTHHTLKHYTLTHLDITILLVTVIINGVQF